MHTAQQVQESAYELVEYARTAKITIATAESLTAGLLASAIADISGASDVLKGGAVTYCDEVKAAVLGVSCTTLERFSAVSSCTAKEMAKGARRLFRSDIAVSLTGYAGPSGGTARDPVGTVYLGLATAEGVQATRYVYSGTRNDIRLAAVAAALHMLIAALK